MGTERDPSSGELETLPAGDAPPIGGADARLPEIAVERYAIGDEVGRGGLGRVLRARDRVLDREVAVKELLGGDDGARRRFVREALITARLQHPSIVSVYEAGRWHDGAPFYAMKLVAGKPLSEAIAVVSTLEARLALLPTVLAVADAIAYAHARHIVHRDLKPGNVLVGEFGETVVIDWGLAKDLSTDDADAVAVGPYREAASDQTVAGSVLGTPAYMAPEQAAGDEIDERADVYALGAMLYHTITGSIPHEGTTLDDVIGRILKGDIAPLSSREPRAPVDLVAIVVKAMSRDPDQRYPSAKELAEDLRRFQTGKLVGAHRYSRLERVTRWIRRHRAVAAVATAAVLVLLVYGSWSVRRIMGETERADRARDEAIANADAAAKQRDHAVAAANRALVAQAHDALSRNTTEALVYLRQLDPSVSDGWDAARLIAADVLSRPREIAAIDQLPPRGQFSIPVFDDDGRRVVIWNEHALYVIDLDSAAMRRYPIAIDKRAVFATAPPVFCDGDRRIALVGRLAGDRADRAYAVDAAGGPMAALPEPDWRVALAHCARAMRARIERGDVRFFDDGDGAFHTVAHTSARNPYTAATGDAAIGIEDDELVRWTRAGVARRVPVDKQATIEDRSEDGNVVIVNGPGQKWAVIHLDTGARVPLPDGPGPASLSPDDKLVVLANGMGVSLLDAQTGQETKTFSGSNNPGRVSLSPDGTWLLSRNGRSMYLWDTTGDDDHITMIGHAPELMYWTPHRLLGWGLDSTLRAWSFDGARLPHRDKPLDENPGVNESKTSPDGRWRVTVGDQLVMRVDTRGHELPELAARGEAGGNVFVGDEGGVLILNGVSWWAWPRHASLAVIETREIDDPALESAALRHTPIEHHARSPDGRWLAIGRPTRAVELIDLSTLAHHPLDGSGGIGVAFLPDGTLVTGAPEGGLLGWNPRDATHRAIVAPDDLRYGEDMPFAIAVSSDGKTLAIGGGGPLFVIDVAKGTPRALEPVEGLKDLIFFDGDRALATAGSDLVIFDLASGFARHIGFGWPRTLVADGDAVIAATYHETVTIRNELPRDPKALLARIAAEPGVDDAARPRVPREVHP